jgi:TP901 family phage tail tape measure protein
MADEIGGMEWVLKMLNDTAAPLAAAMAGIEEYRASVEAANADVAASAEASATAVTSAIGEQDVALVSLGEHLETAGLASEKFQKSLSRAVHSAIEIFAGYEGVKFFAEQAEQLQNALTNLQATTGATGAQLNSAKDQADSLSAAFNFSTESILAADASLANWAGGLANAQAIMPEIITLARALGISISDAADMVKSGITSEGLPATVANVHQLTDAYVALNHALGLNQATAASFDKSISKTLDVAKSYDTDPNVILAISGELQASGAAGSRGGGMATEGLMDALFKRDKKGQSVLDKYHVQTAHTKNGAVDLLGTLQNIKNAGAGVQAQIEQVSPGLQVLASLLPNLEQVQIVANKITNSGGSTNNAAQTQMQTFENTIGSLGEAFDHLRATIGAPMIDSLTPMIEGITADVEALDAFLESHPMFADMAADVVELAAGLLVLVGTFGVLSVALKAAESAFALFDLFADANPIGLVVAAVALLGAGAYELWAHWSAVTKFFDGIGNKLISDFSPFAQYWPGFVSALSTVWLGFVSEIEQIAAPITAVLHDVEQVANLITGMGGVHHSAGGAAVHGASSDIMTKTLGGGRYGSLQPSIAVQGGDVHVTVTGTAASPADVAKAVSDAQSQSLNEMAQKLAALQQRNQRLGFSPAGAQ